MAYKIVATVKDVKGECAAGHKVGDVIELVRFDVKGFICPSAFAAIYPTIFAMKFGAEFPWEEDSDKTLVCCPDPRNLVIFEVRRVKIKE